MPYVSGSQTSRHEGEGGQVGEADRLARGVLAAVDVGEVHQRVGGGADQGEVVLAGLDDAAGGGVRVQLAVAEVDHTWRPSSPPAGVDLARPGLDRVHRVLEQAGDERVVHVGDHADLDGGGGDARRRWPGPSPAGEADGECRRRAPPTARAAADAAAEPSAAGELVLLKKSCIPPPAGPRPQPPPLIPAKRVRLGIRRPVPPRPGPSLLGLIPVPSTTSLPVRFDPATPVRSRRA